MCPKVLNYATKMAAAGGRTVIIRNLSDFTREEQVHALFSMAGRIKLLRMGLYSDTKTPAGFCFVVYANEDGMEGAIEFLDRSKLDGATLEVRKDSAGFTEGRQFRIRKGQSSGPSPDRRPPVNVIAQAQLPESWIQETNHEGTKIWRNVRTFEICYTTPLVIAQMPSVPAPCWDRVENADGVVYMHKVTGEIIKPYKPQARTSELYKRDRKRGPDLSQELPAEKTAIGMKVLEYTVQDLIERSGHMASTRSIFDRKKFWRDFRLVEDRRANGVVLERVRNGEVMARLSYYEAEIFSDNPHLQQVFANGREFLRMKREMTASDRYARSDLTPRTPYQRRQGEAKTVEHWGQRKLVLSEIEFLTMHATKGCTVVYAGAAPGTHINYLSEVLFPDVNFVLVDPAAFDCRPSDRIQIRNTFFTDEIANEYVDQGILFICDIRSTDIGIPTSEREGMVARDMLWQQKWIKIMKPQYSMVKFTLPYCPPPGSTQYLDGKLFMPVFGGRTSTECRLIIDDPESSREWDHEEYESYMFHHNTITRTACFDVSLPRQRRREVGLCRCYDCASEVFILSNFLKQHRGFDDGVALEDEVLRMSTELSAVCSTGDRSLKV